MGPECCARNLSSSLIEARWALETRRVSAGTSASHPLELAPDRILHVLEHDNGGLAGGACLAFNREKLMGFASAHVRNFARALSASGP